MVAPRPKMGTSGGSRVSVRSQGQICTDESLGAVCLKVELKALGRNKVTQQRGSWTPEERRGCGTCLGTPTFAGCLEEVGLQVEDR
jgi:hypothetical protein